MATHQKKPSYIDTVEAAVAGNYVVVKALVEEEIARFPLSNDPSALSAVEVAFQMIGREIDASGKIATRYEFTVPAPLFPESSNNRTTFVVEVSHITEEV